MAAIDFPASPTVGQTFVAGNGVTYQWTGTLWIPIGSTQALYVSDTAPVAPGPNMLWWNSTLGTMFLWYNDGNSTQWVPAMPNLPVGVPAPIVWRQVGRAVAAVAQPSLDFQNVPADINDLMFTFDVTPAVNDQTFQMQFYDSTGTLDATAGHYNSSIGQTYSGIGAGGALAGWGGSTQGFTASIILCTPAVGAAVGTASGIRGHGFIPNIRATTRPHSVDFQTNYVDSGGSYQRSISGGGMRSTVGAITGIHLFFSGNIAAGSVLNVWGSP